jgi:enterochelin esterase-like enzyme
MAFSIFMLWSIGSFGGDAELALGKERQGTLSAGKTQAFTASLNGGDFAQVKLEPHGTELVVIVYDPSGSKFRGAKLGPDDGNVNFVAEHGGVYRLEVVASDKTNEGAFTITLEKVVTPAARLAPPKPVYESPRIKALRASVESGKQASVDAFWEEVKERGAPLIEPLTGDDKNMLVTFLWMGRPDTHNVFVVWFPYAAEGPDDYHMTRLVETNVWYKTVKVDKRKRFMYQLAPDVPRPYGPPDGSNDEIFAIIGAAERIDPLNPKRWAVDPQSVDLPQYQGFSVVEMPAAPVQPWVAVREGVPAGMIEKRQFKSTRLNNEREIAVYVPPGYSKTAKPYELLVLFDEGAYLGDKKQVVLVPAPTILDNLISEHRIPAMVALLVGNAPGARNRELPCNPAFADFLNFELMPWVRRSYNVTTDPQQTVVGGSSYGGLAAAYAGLRHPETFGNILSQSGSFSWSPPRSGSPPDVDPDDKPNWLAQQFIASPRLPLRFYMDAGSDEIDLAGDGSRSLASGRNLRDVLLAKGYEVHFHEFEGGHDYLSWRGTLADGLILLMGTSQTSRPQESAPKP